MRKIEGKYRAFPQVKLVNRQWPNQSMQKEPQWCAVDLRDGNQALRNPMSVKLKKEMFQMLVDVGFKEIEVGFPAASDVEFDFVRELIKEDLIPRDVTIQVLTQAKESIIKRTFEALEGVDKCIIHLYNSTSTVQREVVFRSSREEIIKLGVDNARVIHELARDFEGEVRYEYSPESFTGTELDFAVEICEAVMNVWKPTREKPVIINLPATVEMSMPNVYADQIEWFCNNLQDRDTAIISVHAHNDRGCAVAATELALLAGADRVEGTLFGNGERTGNVDLVTMALNLFSQDVDVSLDFSNIDATVHIYEKCTGMTVGPRHPYAGELVYTAFSGSHQDAIAKGLAREEKKEGGLWEVPYLPIDPTDVGRTYEKVICVNSQSGKGGIADIMSRVFGLELPKPMWPSFGRIVQKETEKVGTELSPESMKALFDAEYLFPDGRFQLQHFDVPERIQNKGNGDSWVAIETVLSDVDKIVELSAEGNGPLNAFCKAFESEGLMITTEFYHEHSLGRDSQSEAISYIKIIDKNSTKTGCWWGVGIDTDTIVASVKAIVSAVNRMEK